MRLTHLLLSALLLLSARSALAVSYDVELIIFEHARRTSIGASDTLLVPVIQRSRNIPQTLPEADVTAEADATPEGAFTALPALRLLDEVARIDASDAYRLLYHGGWRQPALAQDQAPWMRIELGEPQQMFIERSDIGESEDEAHFQVAYATPPLTSELGYTVATSHRLAGAMRVWVGRFLHLESRLAFTPTDSQRSFGIETDRRMRSRRLHYIDHTRIGVIAKIFPVDETAAN